MNPVLLQQGQQFFSPSDPRQTTITLIVFGALLLAGAVAAFVSVRRRGRTGGGGTGLHREARRLGLSTEQRGALRQLSRELSLQNPERLLTNSAFLNHALKRRFEQLDASPLPEAQREQEKSLLFSVRRTVHNAAAQVRMLPSSRLLQTGRPVRVKAADGTTHDSVIASNVHNGLGIEVPYERRPARMNYPKGTPLEVAVVADVERMYTFPTRVIGYNSTRGASIMFVEHAANIRQTQKRRTPRREFDRPCYFYPVTVLTVGKGRRAKTQAFVDKSRRVFGRFEDLSAGGCAIRTQGPSGPKSILKVDFQTSDGTQITVYGRVLSIDADRVRGRIMHIQFTRVSRSHLNQIQSYVYGISEG